MSKKCKKMGLSPNFVPVISICVIFGTTCLLFFALPNIIWSTEHIIANPIYIVALIGTAAILGFVFVLAIWSCLSPGDMICSNLVQVNALFFGFLTINLIMCLVSCLITAQGLSGSRMTKVNEKDMEISRMKIQCCGVNIYLDWKTNANSSSMTVSPWWLQVPTALHKGTSTCRDKNCSVDFPPALIDKLAQEKNMQKFYIDRYYNGHNQVNQVLSRFLLAVLLLFFIEELLFWPMYLYYYPYQNKVERIEEINQDMKRGKLTVTKNYSHCKPDDVKYEDDYVYSDKVITDYVHDITDYSPKPPIFFETMVINQSEVGHEDHYYILV